MLFVTVIIFPRNRSSKLIEEYLQKNDKPHSKLYEFERHYRKCTQEKTTIESARELMKRKCSKTCLKKSLLSTFPFLKIMREYAPLKDLPSDVIAGVTVGIMQIPQGESSVAEGAAE